MKGNPQWMKHRVWIGLVVGILTIVMFYGAAGADNPVTANLKITPSPTVYPGGTLKFQATVFYNPDFSQQPGTMIRCWVTRHDFSWISEKRDIEYPGMGTVTVNFTKGFTVPSTAKAGQVYDFYLVYGIWYPMSDKASVKVIRKLRHKQYYRKIEPLN